MSQEKTCYASHGRSLCSIRLSRIIRSVTASLAGFPSKSTRFTYSTMGMGTSYFFESARAALAEYTPSTTIWTSFIASSMV